MNKEEFEKSMMEYSAPPEFSYEEQAFRRGFHHGFISARQNPEIKEKDVRNWRHNNPEMHPPGMPNY